MDKLAKRRADAPAFPLPGTNYQMQTTALGKPDTFVSPPNAGITLREEIATRLLAALIVRISEQETSNAVLDKAFELADMVIERGSTHPDPSHN